MKYFLYARKSTESEERQALSIEAQFAELREHAAREHLEIAASFEEAKTAKEPGRTVFAEMLRKIERGEADGVLAWHPDRLARNSVDGGQIIYLLDTGKIKALKFPTFWFEPTPQGKFMLNIAFGQSKYYVDNLSENVKRGIRQKLRRGEWCWSAPLGYLNNQHTKLIEIDPKRAPLIRKAFELYATGEHTFQSMTHLLEDAGLRSRKGNVLHLSSVQKILRKHFYYGMLEFQGELYEGKHEPIISKDLFDEVQRVMAGRGKKHRKRKHEFPFIGLMHCGTCGCAVTAELQKGHHYYRCTKKKGNCSEKYLREESLLAQVKAIVEKVSLPDDWADNMLKELDKEGSKARTGNRAVVRCLVEEKEEVERKLEKLLDMKLEGVIETEEYVQKKNKLLQHKAALDQKIRDSERNGNDRLEPMRDFIIRSRQAKTLLSQDNPEEFRAFLKTIGSNVLLK
ncbi:MAG: recombinase family protein, partial [Patescibacteria group bacterium]